MQVTISAPRENDLRRITLAVGEQQEVVMDKFVSATSRRTMIGALATGLAGAISPGDVVLTTRQDDDGDQVPKLCRTRAGRHLSRIRYQTAEMFFETLERSVDTRASDILYRSGIVAQLALSAHLLDVGFADTWCAQHIGLHVSKSLNYANESGFGHDCSHMKRLAIVLSPYSQWRNPCWQGRHPNTGGFNRELISPLLQRLLRQVQHVTGHPIARAVRNNA